MQQRLQTEVEGILHQAEVTVKQVRKESRCSLEELRVEKDAAVGTAVLEAQDRVPKEVKLRDEDMLKSIRQRDL